MVYVRRAVSSAPPLDGIEVDIISNDETAKFSGTGLNKNTTIPDFRSRRFSPKRFGIFSEAMVMFIWSMTNTHHAIKPN